MFAHAVYHGREEESASVLTRPSACWIPLIGLAPPSGTHWCNGRLPRGRAGEHARAGKWLNMKLQGCYTSDGRWRSLGPPRRWLLWRGSIYSPRCLSSYVLNSAGFACRIPRSSCASRKLSLDLAASISRMSFVEKIEEVVRGGVRGGKIIGCVDTRRKWTVFL